MITTGRPGKPRPSLRSERATRACHRTAIAFRTSCEFKSCANCAIEKKHRIANAACFMFMSFFHESVLGPIEVATKELMRRGYQPAHAELLDSTDCGRCFRASVHTAHGISIAPLFGCARRREWRFHILAMDDLGQKYEMARISPMQSSRQFFRCRRLRQPRRKRARGGLPGRSNSIDLPLADIPRSEPATNLGLLSF